MKPFQAHGNDIMVHGEFVHLLYFCVDLASFIKAVKVADLSSVLKLKMEQAVQQISQMCSTQDFFQMLIIDILDASH